MPTSPRGQSALVTSLTVWHYSTAWGADAAEVRLKRLEEEGDIVVHDAVTVIWPPHDNHPGVSHRHRRARDVGLGTTWGALLGTVLGGPVAGAAVGAGAGALRHRRRSQVIDPAVVSQLLEQLGPGTSAMFVLSSGANVSAVLAMLARDPETQLIHHESDSPAIERLLDELTREGREQPH